MSSAPHYRASVLLTFIEGRPRGDLASKTGTEARVRKTPNAGVLVYERCAGRFRQVDAAEPD
ncbi:hypothetical protein, partial [Streptomyces sp. NPDC051561]|uniref:hypothetical protein n=1 Tax=Streptomyces sp. NPDC051561 TaxID=3365658 RepID=UPI00379C774F